MLRTARTLIALLTLPCLLAACLGMPEGVRPVAGFELERYLPVW